jgi:predicted GIY-YIG superfamily endonuclease
LSLNQHLNDSSSVEDHDDCIQDDGTNILKDIERIDLDLLDIERKAKELTKTDINLNSPKQVARVLYNGSNPQGDATSKVQLQKIIKGRYNDGDSSSLSLDQETFGESTRFQREFASLVLEYRSLKKTKQTLWMRNQRCMQAMQQQKQHQGTSPRVSFSLQNMAFSTQSTFNSSISSSSSDQQVQSPILDSKYNDSQNRGQEENDNTEEDSINDYFDQEDEFENETSAPNNLSNRRLKPMQPGTFQDHVYNLFYPPVPTSSSPSCRIDPFWLDALQSITKPSARALISQLNPSCPMGYDPTASPFGNDASKGKTAGKKGSLLGYVREQKEKYPTVVILTRVGEFYEAFGIDAILLVEHCGLNAMANKARAGCPIRNIQATLDGLTSAGFRVAVYEEANDTDASKGGIGASAGSKSRIKNRMLAQIVSPASPTYLYDLVLGDKGSTEDALFSTPSARPYMGVVHSASGYAIVEVALEERTVRVTERVTAEAVACRLASYPPADPLFYIPSMAEESMGMMEKKTFPFLPSRWDTDRDGPGAVHRISVLAPSVYMPTPREGVSDIQRFKQCVVSALLKTVESEAGTAGKKLSHDDFTIVSLDITQHSGVTYTNPLYVETASQLGLMGDPTIPPLVKYLVPDTAPNPTRRFLRRWLLTPPPPTVASSMSNLVGYLKEESPAMPNFEIPPIGKVLSLIRAGQASAEVFREVLVSLYSTVNVIETCLLDERGKEVMLSLINILRYESGIDASPGNLANRCLDAAQVIEEVVNTFDSTYGQLSYEDEISDHANEIVPPAFFERNEAPWRGRIKPEASLEAYALVQKAAASLLKAVATDFWGASSIENMESAKEIRSPIVQDIFNNMIHLKCVPGWTNDKGKYYHPRDRNGKLLRNRYTTQAVEDATSSYIEACEFATASVGRVLTRLSDTLCETGHLPAITQAAHVNLILVTALQHASQANYLGWNLADIVELDDAIESTACELIDLHPYWMDNSEAVLNTFELDKLFLLTAPNMSGKSTIMRSAAAAALLTNCGFCAPVSQGSFVTRFDSIFVRGASSDIPTENKSAFGAEMGDIAALLRACGERSLVFVDELGRGTSPEDGTSLAGAVLEAMSDAKMKGFFATHLHSILDLPLKESALTNISHKRMEVIEEGDDFRWTYKLEDGICKDSRALKTASQFGIPNAIILRAEEFSSHMKAQKFENVLLPKNQSLVIGEGNNQNTDYAFNDDGNLTASITSLIEEVSGSQSVFIKPRWTPPPSLEGCSIVYVMQVGGSFYVGESDSFSQRIRQHRSKGGAWARASAIAVKVHGGKSNAKNLESRLIQKIAQSGYDLISTTDGRKIRPRKR